MGALSTHDEMPSLDEDFDPYDSTQLSNLIRREVQSALQPNRQARTDAEMVEQYNRCVAKYGEDSNFKTVVNEALEQCVRDARTGKPVDIEARYLEASDSTGKRPGQRTAHLPTTARTVKDLGRIIDHNFKTGRARPYKSR